MTSPDAARPRPAGGLAAVARALRYPLLAVVLAWCGRYVYRHWDEARTALAGTTLQWSWLVGSALAVLAAYAVLIQVWRSILAGAGESLPYGEATRIWTVSNLGKYLPGKVWQMTAMALMAREQGVSGVVAAGSSVLSTLVTLVTGMAVTILTGAGLLPDRRAALAVGAACLVALVVMPVGLPIAERVLRRATGREVTLPRLSGRAFGIAVIGSSLGWLLLGSGFHLLARGLGVEGIVWSASVAVFVASYLVGFLALFAPGGIGPRETVMQGMLASLGVVRGEALVLVVASRLWLTVLEILPALVFIAVGFARRQPGAPYERDA